MSQPGNSKLRDFTQKMRNEGSAAFAGGPWDDVKEPETQSQSAAERQQSSWSIPPVQTRKPGKKSPRGMEDRILAWVAIMALATFITGILGTYLSYKPGRKPATTRIEPVTRAPDLARLEARLSALEKRFQQVLDPLRARLQTIEKQLVLNRDQFEARLVELENNLPPATDGYRIRLLQLEQKLADTAGRLDEISLAVATSGSRYRSIPEPGEHTAATVREVALPEPVATDPVATTPQSPATFREIDNQPSERPLPAAPGDALRAAAGVQGEVFRGPQPEREPAATRELQPVVEPARVREPMPVMDSAQVVEPEPVPQPAEPPAMVSASPPEVPGTGKWSINIASYANRRVANKMLAEFRQQGVAAVQVSATVNGKTIYRVRVPGFATRRAAETAAVTIRKQLGLQETWITKR